MRKQDRLLSGVVALPYNEQDIKRTLAKDLEQQTKNTGRFWSLSFSQFLNILPKQNQNGEQKNKVTNFKQKLELDYNLDAWLKPSVIFSPDQTLVRLTLSGIGQAKSNWAREDILLEAQASEDKVRSAFYEALARIIATIGHDGRVTYTRDNLMTIDFGSERGLTRGQKIIAGYVILTGFHPQSGEFLRAERVPLYELKVLEARKGSSLCQITAIDKVKQEQIVKMYDSSTLIMLAWRENNIEKNVGWHEPYDPQTAPILGATETGFGVPLQKKELPALPNNMIDPSSQESIKHVAINSPQQNNVTTNIAEPAPTYSNDEMQRRYFRKRSRFDAPATWNITDIKLGVGLTLGSFAEGESSAFPVTLINRLNASGFMRIDSDYKLYAEPYAQYAFFNGTNVSGNSYVVGTTIYNAAWSDSPQMQNFYIGAGVEITGGSISGITQSSDLANFQINPSIKWDATVAGFGRYSAEGAFSIFDIIQNYPIWSLRAEVQPFDLMTKQIYFDAGMKRYTHDWIEFSIGAGWNFAPN